jgi:hypothetical protein
MELEKGGNDYDYNIMQQKRWKDSNVLSIVNWLTIQINPDILTILEIPMHFNSIIYKF